MASSNLSPGHDIPAIGEAGLFLKATSSLVGPSQGIRIRFPERRTDHEIELVAVIGKTASEVPPERALQHVAGYCLGLDITLRGREDRSFRKSIDTYSVIGPWLTTVDEVPDPQDLRLVLRKNGEIRQDASTSDMVYSVAQLIAYASSFYTLLPGDLIFTGTPQGVSAIREGDHLSVEATVLGRMDVVVSSHGRSS
jgi:2-keto-4-pentenoate hydratase/2-oxohepta-3-ene-1,7-dioic acid hydratase in catechol pathway